MPRTTSRSGCWTRCAEEEPGENLFLSPLSVSMALGMGANGARGETLDAMRETLGLGHLTRSEMNEAYRGLLDLLPGLDPQVTLGIANSAWLMDGFPFRTSFVDRLESYFDAEARELDFGAPGALDVVNGWVAERTQGRIEEILQEVKEEDILYLINSVYFDGSWRSRFDPAETEAGPFQLADGSTVEVPFMAQEDMGGLYGRPEGVRIADLPYGGDAFSITLVVPTGSGTLDEVLDSLTPEVWQGWMDGLSENGYLVRLPRFELEASTSLKDPLLEMGMGLAFSDLEADFGDMHTSDRQVVIDRVRHRTFLRVDEEGTEAAGVTFIGWVTTSAGNTPTFSLDRPFLVAIRERLSGTILFLGAVYDPS